MDENKELIVEDQIVDHSTVKGKILQITHGWKGYCILAVCALVILFFLITLIFLYTAPTENKHLLQIFDNGSYIYSGDETKFVKRHLDEFPGFSNLTNNKIKSIELKWVRISNSTEFSRSLTNFTNLEVLILNNVTMFGLLEPTKLPKLKQFILKLGLENPQAASGDFDVISTVTPWLYSTLFFMNKESEDMKTFYKKLGKTRVIVSVYLKGSIVYGVDRRNGGEIRLSLPECKETLNAVKWKYERITLGRCKDLIPGTISKDATYLNFYIASISTEELAAILKKLPKLKEFYAELPAARSGAHIGEIKRVNLNDFSKTLTTFSVSSMIIDAMDNLTTNVENFYFGAENSYGWVAERETQLNLNIVHNFSTMFPKAKEVGIFDMNINRYVFLNNLIEIGIESIVVIGFKRDLNVPKGEEIEKLLTNFGMPNDETNFIINANNGTLRGRSLDTMEKMYYRYKMLGWDAIDTFNKFLYVEKLIEDGKILGKDQ